MSLVVALLLAPTTAANAQARLPSGYLCCNLRINSDWISDINYRQEGSRVLPAGTAVRGLAWGRYSVQLQIGSQQIWFGNDYSRDLDDRAFSARYIVGNNPRNRIASAHPIVQDAIRRSQVLPGMTDAEAAMALGYPVARYTPSLSAREWKYWIDRTGEYSVHLDGARRVRSVGGDPRAVGVVQYQPSPALMRQIQAVLKDHGHLIGDPDGRFGPTTRTALREFQKDNGLEASGRIDVDTIRRMGQAVLEPLQNPTTASR